MSWTGRNGERKRELNYEHEAKIKRKLWNRENEQAMGELFLRGEENWWKLWETNSGKLEREVARFWEGCKEAWKARSQEELGELLFQFLLERSTPRCKRYGFFYILFYYIALHIFFLWFLALICYLGAIFLCFFLIFFWYSHEDKSGYGFQFWY